MPHYMPLLFMFRYMYLYMCLFEYLCVSLSMSLGLFLCLFVPVIYPFLSIVHKLMSWKFIISCEFIRIYRPSCSQQDINCHVLKHCVK